MFYMLDKNVFLVLIKIFTLNSIEYLNVFLSMDEKLIVINYMITVIQTAGPSWTLCLYANRGGQVHYGPDVLDG